MKNIISNLKIYYLTALLVLASAKSFANISDSVIFQNDSTFTIESLKEELGRDGQWIKVNKDEIDPDGVHDKSEGLDDEINTDYIWKPYGVDENWSPYTNGYWIYTNCGWMWVSYYSWGWRTCHYGRWWWSPVWGWVWSPGFIWAPAWVIWIYNDYYCGWYPISPWVRWHYSYGYHCGIMKFKVKCWVFVEKPRFCSVISADNTVKDFSKQKDIIRNAKYDFNPVITEKGVKINGPDLTDIEKSTGSKQQIKDVSIYNNSAKYIKSRNDDDYNVSKNNNKQKYSDKSDRIGIDKNRVDNDKSNRNNNKDVYEKDYSDEYDKNSEHEKNKFKNKNDDYRFSRDNDKNKSSDKKNESNKSDNNRVKYEKENNTNTKKEHNYRKDDSQKQAPKSETKESNKQDYSKERNNK